MSLWEILLPIELSEPYVGAKEKNDLIQNIQNPDQNWPDSGRQTQLVRSPDHIPGRPEQMHWGHIIWKQFKKILYDPFISEINE